MQIRVVKRTAMGKRLRFFFAMFSTVGLILLWEKLFIKSSLARHLLALALPTFTYDTTIWGGKLKNSLWKVLRRAWSCILMSHWLPVIFCWLDLENILYKYTLSSSRWSFNNILPASLRTWNKGWVRDG